MTGLSSGAELRKHLDRWVAEGLIDTAQATRIESAEAPATGARAPLVAEALGYAGGVLAIAAGLYTVRDFWPNLSTGTVLAFAAAACVALGAGGAAVRTTSDPALRRLRSVVWLMSTVSLAVFAGTLADQVWGFGPASTTLVAATASAAYGTALWRRTRAALQHLAVFASLAVLAGTGLVAGILLDDAEELTPELVDGAINALRRRGLERRQRQVRAQIAEAERRQDASELGRLLRQKVEIDRALGSAAAPGSSA